MDAKTYMMSLRVKERYRQMARELAAFHGSSLTAAVEYAIRATAADLGLWDTGGRTMRAGNPLALAEAPPRPTYNREPSGEPTHVFSLRLTKAAGIMMRDIADARRSTLTEAVEYALHRTASQLGLWTADTGE